MAQRDILSVRKLMQCQHTKTVGSNCAECGTFVSSAGTAALAEVEFRFQPRVDVAMISQSMYAHQGTNRLFQPSSPYVVYRRLLVDWVCETAEQIHLQSVTAHSAVALMDTLLATKEVEKPKLQLMAISCLLVAAKFEEVDDRAPTLSLLFSKCSRKFSVMQLRSAELVVLSQLNWELKSSTPMHFISHFIAQGVVFPTDQVDTRPATESITRYVRKYAEFFADLCLQEYDFQKYSSGLLGCACIAAARSLLKIEPIWSCELEQMTRIEASEVTAPVEHILQYPLHRYYGEVFPKKRRQDSVTHVATPMRQNSMQTGEGVQKKPVTTRGKENRCHSISGVLE